jgi:hypothetical protein
MNVNRLDTDSDNVNNVDVDDSASSKVSNSPDSDGDVLSHNAQCRCYCEDDYDDGLYYGTQHVKEFTSAKKSISYMTFYGKYGITCQVVTIYSIPQCRYSA